MKAFCTVVLLLFAVPLAAKDAKPVYAVNCDDPHAYACTQYLRLEVKQRDVQLAYVGYMQAIAALNAEAEKIKTENGWPEGVTFKGDTLRFQAPDLVPPQTEKP